MSAILPSQRWRNNDQDRRLKPLPDIVYRCTNCGHEQGEPRSSYSKYNDWRCDKCGGRVSHRKK